MKKILAAMNSKNRFTNTSLKKILLITLVLNLVQLLLILMLFFYGIINPAKEATYLIYISAIITAFNSAVTALGYYLIFYRKSSSSILDTVRNLEEFNRKLREQRHDYLNHIQIIYGLMELNEFSEAKKYIEPVYKDILKVSKAMRTSQPAVNALLQAKMKMAEKYNIDVYLEIKTDLSKLSLEPWEFCKVLSNVIDNGIQALSKVEGERALNIDIGEDMSNYYIYIYNNGPKISESILSNIFEEGFTTKEGEGHGMGLFIVKRILEDSKGHIKISSDDRKTTVAIITSKNSNMTLQ